MTIGDIAKTCYEVERAFMAGLGDHLRPEWHSAPERTRMFTMIGVGLILTERGSGREVTVESLHEKWCESKKSDGWSYGPKLDPYLHTHPYLVPFAELPIREKTKQVLFLTTVLGLEANLAQEPEEAEAV